MENIVFNENFVMYADKTYLDIKGVIVAYERGDTLSEIKKQFNFKADLYTLSYIINRYIAENSIKYVKSTRISNISPEKIYELTITKKISFSELVLEYDVSRTTLKEKKLDVYCKEHSINLQEVRENQLKKMRKNKEQFIHKKQKDIHNSQKIDTQNNDNRQDSIETSIEEKQKSKRIVYPKETKPRFPKAWVSKFLKQTGKGYNELVEHAKSRGYYIPEEYKTEFFGTEFENENQKIKGQEELLKASRKFVTDKINNYFHNAKTKETDPDLIQKYIEDIFRISIKLHCKNIGLKERIASLLYSLTNTIDVDDNEIIELIQNDEDIKKAIEALTSNNIENIKRNSIAKNVKLALKLEELENPLIGESYIIWNDYIIYYEMSKGTEFETDYEKIKIKYNKEKEDGPSIDD